MEKRRSKQEDLARPNCLRFAHPAEADWSPQKRLGGILGCLGESRRVAGFTKCDRLEKLPREVQGCFSDAQGVNKSFLRPAQRRPRPSTLEANLFPVEGSSKTAILRPKLTPNTFKLTQTDPKWHQEEPKRPKRGPTDAQERPKDVQKAFKRGQEAPKRRQDRSGGAQEKPRGAQEDRRPP